MSMGRYDFAANFLETCRKVMRDVIGEERPVYRYATVISVTGDNKKATIRYPGETNNVTVRVECAGNPVVNDVVRIEGLSGDKYIAAIRR